jgi:acyl-CoA synthetase (AMP-forming)/AMP-acid ligase II
MRGAGDRAGFCAGRPVPGLRARLIKLHRGPIQLGPDGWQAWSVPEGEIGELVVCGGHVCQGYYRNPEAAALNKITGDDGAVWHRMGDTGYFDRHGCFWLTGRLHSAIQRDGAWVQPQLVEQAGRGCDERVRRIAAVGLPDPVHGERVVVVLEAAGPPAGLAEDVLSRIRTAGLPADQVLVSRRSLPVDPRHNAKIDYPRLRRRLRARQRSDEP